MKDSDFDRYKEGIKIKNKIYELSQGRDVIMYAMDKKNWEDKSGSPIGVHLKDGGFLQIISKKVVDTYLPKILSDYLSDVNKEIESLKRQFSNL